MGRARKLANAWQPEAGLLGIEATLLDGKIPTQAGGTAKIVLGHHRSAVPRCIPVPSW